MPEKDLTQRFKLVHKMRLVAESWKLKDEKLGHFLRTNGISSPELMAWRDQMQEGLEEGIPLPRSEKRRYKAQIARLEEEVRQLRVVNEIQKKVQVLLEQEKVKNTVKKSGRRPVKSLKKVLIKK
jgi:transposase-like protein